jgi:hypothetical protein
VQTSNGKGCYCGDHRVRHRQIIADNLSKAGWSWGCVSTVDSLGRTIWIVDVHRDDGRRFVVRADAKLTAFVELESANRSLPPSICDGLELRLEE